MRQIAVRQNVSEVKFCGLMANCGTIGHQGAEFDPSKI